jgi:Tat protein translocase TatB subunit
MPQIGPLEIFLVAAIALIVFGPQKLPEIARNVGRAVKTLRKMASEVREEFETELSALDVKDDEPTPKHRVPKNDSPEPVRASDADEVLKPGEPGPGDDAVETPPEPMGAVALPETAEGNGTRPDEP